MLEATCLANYIAIIDLQISDPTTLSIGDLLVLDLQTWLLEADFRLRAKFLLGARLGGGSVL